MVRAVAALTSREGEDYFAFVERAAADPVARAVKLAGIEDNMDLSRLADPSPKDQARVVRYRRARKLLQLAGRAAGDPAVITPTILPLRNDMPLAEVLDECPGDRPVIVCDFYVAGAEAWEVVTGGLRHGRVLNVDHHAKLPVMYSQRTSTRLAYEYLQAGGSAAGAWVVINHTDCDSMLSSAMLLGLIPPERRFVDASVAADHSGEANEIADLLQALDEARSGDRTEADNLTSLRNLQLLLAGVALEPAAESAVAERRARREAVRQLAAAVTVRDGVAVLELDEEIDGAFFPPMLPDAAVIMLVTWHPEHPTRRVMKLRLGAAAPAGLTIAQLGVKGWDDGFGGRWNAGSNKRGKGTLIEVEEYAARVRRAVAAVRS